MSHCYKSNTYIKKYLTVQETELGLRSYPPHYLRTLPTSRSDSYIRLANFTPTFPPIDVFLDGIRYGSNLAFTDITDYFEVRPGKHTLSVYASDDPEKEPLFVTTLTVPVADIVSTFVFGFDDINFLLLSDDFRVLPNEVGVKFTHLSPNAPALDLYINDKPLFTTINFSDSSRNVYLPYEPSYNVKLKVAGIDSTIVELPNMTFRPGNSYTFNAIGLYSGVPPLQLVTTLNGSTY